MFDLTNDDFIRTTIGFESLDQAVMRAMVEGTWKHSSQAPLIRPCGNFSPISGTARGISAPTSRCGGTTTFRSCPTRSPRFCSVRTDDRTRDLRVAAVAEADLLASILRLRSPSSSRSSRPSMFSSQVLGMPEPPGGLLQQAAKAQPLWHARGDHRLRQPVGSVSLVRECKLTLSFRQIDLSGRTRPP